MARRKKPRRKCDNDVTHAPAGPRGPPACKPVWPRTGDLVSWAWTDSRVIEGVVIDAQDRGWNPPMLTILTYSGERMMCSSPHVRIVSNRRRGVRRVCNGRPAVV